ncbi:hypothetical protein NO932_11775 [Pelagibacterium sp. 26DY04]|uniref:hypothetical protein n=1 Tax=Pelagibacterium sp. 26DY04 TaxID=2967130 RepID=UPI002814B396|nr:hypothetical protein [Pelagibacterium sp. 26DY04]WMT85607.1 hypothetical protein NO932_11775 [Pelagibacterium sp. 26DY04]
MSEHKFTPGPWKRGDCDSWIIWASGYASTDWIRCEPGPEAVCVASLDVPAWAQVETDGVTREAWLAEASATADLIAAAPEMLEALEPLGEHATMRAVDMPEWRDRDMVQIVVTIGQLRAIRNALAKATGGPHDKE